MSGPSIEARSLRKTFGTVEAVKDVSFQVRPGEIYGLLGPNGAGKTTTVRMLVGLMRPDAGTVLVDGSELDPDGAPRPVLGYVPDEPPLYDKLSGGEMLDLAAALRQLPPSVVSEVQATVLDDLGFAPEALDRFTMTYSRGMRRKLAIALGLLHRPDTIVLDEPTDSLDATATEQVRALVRGLGREGRAVLLATNDLASAEAVCDRIGIISHGVVAREVTREEFATSAPEGHRSLERVFHSTVDGR